jgi:hypothetical protein
LEKEREREFGKGKGVWTKTRVGTRSGRGEGDEDDRLRQQTRKYCCAYLPNKTTVVVLILFLSSFTPA